MDHAAIAAIVDRQKTGFSLSREMYSEAAIFDAEMEIFLSRQWILAGHRARIPETGKYFLFDIAGYSIVVIRTGPGENDIAAHHNLCRHRGARLCEEPSGKVKRLLCRYHAWSYKLSGELASWRHMPDGLDSGDFRLKSCGIKIHQGAIFLSLSPDSAPDFDRMVAHVDGRWARYDLGNCEIAHRATYDLGANWKLGIENNLECYHCLAAHPEYTAVHDFVKADEKVSAEAERRFDDYLAHWKTEMVARSVPTGRTDYLETDGQLCRAMTWPIRPGFLTGTRDGKAMLPLLGDIPDHDESVTSGCFGYNSYFIAYCDYAVIFSYVPQAVDRTTIELTWLVRAGASEQPGFDLQHLCHLWDVTTRQDKDIIELNAAGVAARAYEPGPYSLLEAGSQDFVERYKTLMKKGLSAFADASCQAAA